MASFPFPAAPCLPQAAEPWRAPYGSLIPGAGLGTISSFFLEQGVFPRHRHHSLLCFIHLLKRAAFQKPFSRQPTSSNPAVTIAPYPASLPPENTWACFCYYCRGSPWESEHRQGRDLAFPFTPVLCVSENVRAGDTFCRWMDGQMHAFVLGSTAATSHWMFPLALTASQWSGHHICFIARTSTVHSNDVI